MFVGRENKKVCIQSANWVVVDKRFILSSNEMRMCAQVLPSLPLPPHSLQIIMTLSLRKWNLRKIWTWEWGSPALMCIRKEGEREKGWKGLTAYTCFVISKVRSTWNYIEFNCTFPPLWRWINSSTILLHQQSSMHPARNSVSLRYIIIIIIICFRWIRATCVNIETHFFSGSPFLTIP